MSVSSSEMLCLGVSLKESPRFSISVLCLVKNMLDKVISFEDNFSVVVGNGVDSFLNKKFQFVLVIVQPILIDYPRYHHLVFYYLYLSSNQDSSSIL